MRALIEELPARLRSAFLLHYYAGFGVREVATMLGRPEGTVKADLLPRAGPPEGGARRCP